VISILALVVAVGGGTFAFAALNNKKVRKISTSTANKLITKRAASLSVNHAKTADTATTATNATNATSATNANNANSLGGIAATGYQHRVLWAIINSNGTEIVAQSGGISLTGHTSPGLYGIRFPASTQNTALLVTPTIAGFAGSSAGSSDAKVGPCPVSPDCGGVKATTSNDAVVATFAAGALADRGFYITLTQ
jgi:hypothetical protein